VDQGRRQRGRGLDRRLSVNLTVDVYDSLDQLAQRHGVSLSWLTRQACERLLHDAEQGQLALPLGSGR
jgi:predicted DNA-binding protein